jgi:hypothetical protein
MYLSRPVFDIYTFTFVTNIIGIRICIRHRQVSCPNPTPKENMKINMILVISIRIRSIYIPAKDECSQIRSNLSYRRAPDPVTNPEQGAFAVPHRNSDRCTEKHLDLRLKLDRQCRPNSIFLVRWNHSHRVRWSLLSLERVKAAAADRQHDGGIGRKKNTKKRPTTPRCRSAGSLILADLKNFRTKI